MAGDAHFEKVVLLLHGEGGNGSTQFTDSGPAARTPAAIVGGAQISTGWSAFGSSAMKFNGSGAFIAYADASDLRLGASDFTIECRVRLTGYAASSGGEYGATIISKDDSGAREYFVVISGTASEYTTLKFQGFSGNTTSVAVQAGYAFNLNTDYAVAVTRSGGRVYLFVNGVLLNPGGTAFAVTIQGTASPTRIGALYFDGGATYNYYFNGYIDELRLTKGVARYTATYTADTSAFADRAGQITGMVRDDAGAFASRTLRAIYRDTGALAGSAVSSAVDGRYQMDCARLAECDVVCLDDASGAVYNDLILRVTPG